MFADPQSVTVAAVSTSLPRVRTGEFDANYRSADGEFELRISHQESKSRIRRLVRLDQKKVAADPLTAVNSYQKAGVYFVIDEPTIGGFSDAELEDMREALVGWLTEANFAKVVAGEY